MAAVVLLLGLGVGCLVAIGLRGGRCWRPDAPTVAGVAFLVAAVLAVPLARPWAVGLFAVALAAAGYRETTRRRVRHASPAHDTTTVTATPS